MNVSSDVARQQLYRWSNTLSRLGILFTDPEHSKVILQFRGVIVACSDEGLIIKGDAGRAIVSLAGVSYTFSNVQQPIDSEAEFWNEDSFVTFLQITFPGSATLTLLEFKTDPIN